MNQNRRKVGQDMIVRKQPQPSVVVPRKVPAPGPVLKNKTAHHAEPSLPLRAAHLDNHPPRMKYVAPSTPARGGLLWYLVGICTLVLLFMIVSLLQHAQVRLVLEQQTIQLPPTTVTLLSEPGNEQVGFKTAITNDVQSVTVPAKQKKQVALKSTGTVVITGNPSADVILPAGTVITETTSGKTYALNEKIVFPQTSEPITKKTTITATAAGAEFNQTDAVFSIDLAPGLSVRSDGPIAGGFVGEQNSLSESELVVAKTSVMTLFSGTSPATFLTHQIPDGWLLPQNTVTVSDPMFTTESVEGGVRVIGTRTVTGIMIRSVDFQNYINQQIIPESSRSFMRVTDISGIVFQKGGMAGIAPENATSLPVIISGTLITQAFTDEPKIVSLVALQKKRTALSKITTLPGVVDASISLRPVWFLKVPGKSRQISVTIIHAEPKSP